MMLNWFSDLPLLLNMSITGTVVILFVLLFRLILKKAPKKIVCVLWLIVLFRLLCPVAPTSDMSLMGALEKAQIKTEIEMQTERDQTQLQPIQVIPDGTAPAAPQTWESVSGQLFEKPTQMSLPIADEAALQTQKSDGQTADWRFIVWAAGAAVMVICSILSLLRLRRKLIGAVKLRDNIYLADHIETPFVLGILRPRIMLPSSLSQQEQDYIILHEKTHIRRLDHVRKLLHFAALCIHWFNPFVWLSFVLAGQDMEMACDERVLGTLGTQIRADYSGSLLRLATGHRIFAGAPLAFGEGDPKNRIRHVLNWKKPALWIIVLALIVAGSAAIVLGTNPVSLENPIGGAYQAGKLLYEAPDYREERALQEMPLYALDGSGVLYEQNDTEDQIWSRIGESEQISLSAAELCAMYSPGSAKVYAKMAGVRTVRRVLADGQKFYLLMQTNRDVLMAVGYGEGENSRIRWLFRLDRMGEYLPLQEMIEQNARISEESAEKAASDNRTEGRSLTQAELDVWNERLQFALPNPDDDGKYTVNPLCLFSFCEFDKPENIDLERFCRYFPEDSEPISEREFSLLKQDALWPFQKDMESMDDMPVPIHRHPASDIDAMLRKYTDIGLRDLQQTPESLPGLLYLPESDAYYNFTSDAGLTGFTCSSGWQYGNVVTLFGVSQPNTQSTLVLWELDGEIKLLSHEILDKAARHDISEVKSEREAFYELFWELDQESFDAYLERNPDVLANGWNGIHINEAGFEEKGIDAYTIYGEQVLGLDAKNGVLLIRVSGSDWRGVLGIGKNPSLLNIEVADTIGVCGQSVGEIAENHSGILAMNANPFWDEDEQGNQGNGNGGILAGYTRSNGAAYGSHFTAWGYKRLELHEDNLMYIKDVGNSVADDCTDCCEFAPAMIIDGQQIVDYGYTGTHPRAAIGQSDKYEILMLCIEGRQTQSLGTDVNTCIEIMMRHHCMQALNLDGGSSAMLWFDGKDCISSSSKPLRDLGGRPLPNAWVYHFADWSDTTDASAAYRKE